MKVTCSVCKTSVNIDETPYSYGEKAEAFCPRCGNLVSGIVEKDSPSTSPKIKAQERPEKVASDSDALQKQKELELREREIALREQELEFKRQERIREEKESKEQQEQKVADPPMEDYTPPVPPQYASTDYYPYEEPKKGLSGTTWFIIISLIVVSVAVLIFIATGGSGSSDKAETADAAWATKEVIPEERATVAVVEETPAEEAPTEEGDIYEEPESTWLTDFHGSRLKPDPARGYVSFPEEFFGTDERWHAYKSTQSGGNMLLSGSGFISDNSIELECLLRPNGTVVGRYHNENGTNLDMNGMLSSGGDNLIINLGHDSNGTYSQWRLYPVDYESEDGWYVFEGTWGKSNKPSRLILKKI